MIITDKNCSILMALDSNGVNGFMQSKLSWWLSIKYANKAKEWKRLNTASFPGGRRTSHTAAVSY